MIPTHGQMGRVLVEVVGGAPHDVQVAAGPRDPVVGSPRAPVPCKKKKYIFFKRFNFNLTSQGKHLKHLFVFLKFRIGLLSSQYSFSVSV